MKPGILRLTIPTPWAEGKNTVYPILLWGGRDIILVDCGFTGSLGAPERELGRHGLSAEQLTGLMLTHHDHDHMGAAAALSLWMEQGPTAITGDAKGPGPCGDGPQSQPADGKRAFENTLKSPFSSVTDRHHFFYSQSVY